MKKRQLEKAWSAHRSELVAGSQSHNGLMNKYKIIHRVLDAETSSV